MTSGRFAVLSSQLILRSIQETTIKKKSESHKAVAAPSFAVSSEKAFPLLFPAGLGHVSESCSALWLLQISAELLRPTETSTAAWWGIRWDHWKNGVRGNTTVLLLWRFVGQWSITSEHLLNSRVLGEGCSYALSCIGSLWGYYINSLWPKEYWVDAGILGAEESCAAIAVRKCGNFAAAGIFANFCLCVPFQPRYPARVCGGGKFFASLL